MALIKRKPGALISQARQMRHQPTPAEKILWGVLRNRQIEDCKFVRQYPLSLYIVDFCCREKKLVIEVDGGIHVGREKFDREREKDLFQLGYRVIRFTNDDVTGNINAVAAAIQDALRS